jgi:hypothetical protein
MKSGEMLIKIKVLTANEKNLLDNFFIALNKKIRLIRLDSLNPLSILLDKVENESCNILSILISVSCWLDIC